ncbi:MAG: HAMP domain-containing histidine kinase [Gammaproteobacteria bacterium]|nr:HAMP domain-containing histidine kinase [Gammaproteobacteria bacterium]
MNETQRSSGTVNLGRLVVYRHLALVAQGIAVPSAIYGLGLQLDAFPLLAIITVYGIYNGITWWRLRHGAVITEPQLFAQLLVDVAEMVALLYLTGGASNPFVWFFLVPLTLTAASLPAVYSWAMAAITSASYSLLLFYNVPLPHQHGGGDFNLHVIGMWTGYLLSAALIAYFAVHMNNTLRQRDLALARAREQTLRDERLVALGTLAAGAAHEMGTPLATMAVVTRELKRDYAHLPELTEQLDVVRSQIDRCKGILSSMAAAAGQNRADAGYQMSLDRYLADLIERWRQTRPKVEVRYIACDVLAPTIIAEQTLSQSIINVLNNAADASEHDVEVTAQWDAQTLTLEICDRGPGLDSEAEARAGELLFTTKAPGEGHGIGLFLAQSTISRLGGSMRLCNREGGGACTRIELPLTQLLVQA